MSKLNYDDEILENYQNILSQAKRSTRNDEDAEDIAQNTFLNYHRGRKSFRGDSKLSSFLYSIAQNEINMHYRKKKQWDKKVHALREFQNSALFQTYSKMDIKPKEILKLLDNITSDNEKKMLFYQISGIGSNEIAQMMGVTVPAAKSAIHRLKLRLKGKRSKFYDKLRREA